MNIFMMPLFTWHIEVNYFILICIIDVKCCLKIIFHEVNLLWYEAHYFLHFLQRFPMFKILHPKMLSYRLLSHQLKQS
jgi:hypothetical protein